MSFPKQLDTDNQSKDGDVYPDEDGLEWQNVVLEGQSDDQETRSQIEDFGVESLVVDDLQESDLADIAWAGDPIHIQAVKDSLIRAKEGTVDYLAVRAPNGKPIAKGGIGYSKNEGAGYMWQLATMESLRGLGIGTKLITAMEERIKSRGLNAATLGVEAGNKLARGLYEKLGYEVYGHEQESWEKLDANGQNYTHHAEVDLMRKELA